MDIACIRMNGLNLELILCSDFWVFDAPIFPQWIPAEDARNELEKGALCKNQLNEELKNILLENLTSLIALEMLIVDLANYKMAEKHKHCRI